MYKANLILFIILFSSVQGKAQQKDFAYYDSLTYKLYMDKDYKQLLKVGDEALKSGLDYYYLRMRTGTAAYNLKRYRIATPHFEKASAFSNNDVVDEYLYYSTLWGGEPLKARGVVEGMSAELKSRLGITEDGVSGASVDMAILNQAEDISVGFDLPKDEEGNYIEGAQIVPTQFFDMSVSLSHDLGSKATMTHSLSYLYRSSDNLTPNDGDGKWDVNVFNSNQFQYYIGTAINLGNSWNLNLGGHLSAVAFPEYTERSFRGYSQVIKTTVWDYDFVFSASILKNLTYASVEGEMVILSLNGESVYQPTGTLRLYPFANLNLYTQSQFSYQIKDNSNSFFHQQKIGFKVLKHLWMEANYFSGDVSGFTLGNGSLLFNGVEEVNSMIGGMLIIPTKSKLTFTLGYQNRVQSNYFYPDADVNVRSNKLELNYSLLFMLLSWTL